MLVPAEYREAGCPPRRELVHRRPDALPHNQASSQFIAGITNLQLELPALKGHQHVAEILPGDFQTIDNDEWHATDLGIIPFDSPSHRLIGDMKSLPIVLKVLDGKRSAYFLDQPAQQGEQITFGIADHLKLIAGCVSFSKLKGIQSDTAPKQTCPEMELMCFTSAVGYSNGFQSDVLKIIQTAQLGHLCVDASGAKRSISFIHGTVVDDIVAGYDLPTPLAMKLLHVDYLVCRRQGADFGAFMGTNAIQFTKFPAAIMTYLSVSSGTIPIQ